jgi:hypothetical protein
MHDLDNLNWHSDAISLAAESDRGLQRRQAFLARNVGPLLPASKTIIDEAFGEPLQLKESALNKVMVGFYADV